MKKNEKQLPKTKKTSRDSKTVTIRIPGDVHASLKNLAGSHDMSVSALLKFYVQQIVEQEVDDESTAAVYEPIIDSEQKKVDLKNVQQNKHAHTPGIRYEILGISSSQFTPIYFRGFRWALVGNIIISVVPWGIQGNPIFAIVLPILCILWAIGSIVIGSLRKTGSGAIFGWGWIAGTLSLIVVPVIIYFFLDLGLGVESLAILLAGIVIIGLLVNVPAELNTLFVKRRTKRINERVNHWGGEICNALINREIFPGMTKEMVAMGWGEPTKMEYQEATENSKTEKWVYKLFRKSLHIWFANGVVSKINDTGK